MEATATALNAAAYARGGVPNAEAARCGEKEQRQLTTASRVQQTVLELKREWTTGLMAMAEQ